MILQILGLFFVVIINVWFAIRIGDWCFDRMSGERAGGVIILSFFPSVVAGCQTFTWKNSSTSETLWSS